ncbi:MBL fold metallo-hydrolase [Actinoplanes flavus]|uniref:MBL fold metallo-hydrolase n=1 Tax=Actinoplanes flavus TaxID=2820290 RepID=A0ABS3UVH1_9ACTN|nr:MBL fold metallo-hydrolase [Actinoplanes flavus]MBO3742583.1 MBL fold metallo-hydrolase [Actinoplanes flavus]
MRKVFLGVSTVLLSDGRTTLLTDGFFSRPGLLRVLAGRVRPDRERIAAALRRFGITSVDGLFVMHSHYDHALDAPTVAMMTGARLFGSASTRNIALGHGFPVDRFTTTDQVEIGNFRIRVLPTLHSPGDLFPGTVDRPIGLGARARDYRTGECHTLHVTHGDERLLIHASANHADLDGHPAGTVFLGVGGLGKQSAGFRATYWDRLVRRTGARRVVPIHWDDFTRPLDRPLRPMPRFADDFRTTMRFLGEQAAIDDVELTLPTLGEPL